VFNVFKLFFIIINSLKS